MGEEDSAYNEEVGLQLWWAIKQVNKEGGRKRGTIREAARLAGVHEQTMYTYLNGERDIPVQVVRSVAAYSGVPASIILARAEALLAHRLERR